MLCAALLLAQLSNKVQYAIKIQFSGIYHWTDSSIVLSWIRSSSNTWKIFISNRISQIQTLTKAESWNYVNTKCNPANLLSRGLDPRNVLSSKLWWHGPTWLSTSIDNWPQTQLKHYAKTEYPPEIKSELKRDCLTITYVSTVFNIIDKFSSFTRLQRVVAYCLRFKSNCLVPKSRRRIGPLSSSELDTAVSALIRIVQQQAFAKELSDLQRVGSVNKGSRILSLSPFLDSGIIKVGGRLRYAPFDIRKRHPAVLPPDSALSVLIVEYEHKRLLHAAPNTVLASVRERYWIIAGKNLVKKICRNCLRCF